MNIKQNFNNTGAGIGGAESINKARKLSVMVILVSVVIAGIIIAGSLYLESHTEIIEKYLPVNNSSSAEAVENFMEPIVFVFFGGVLFLMFATIIYKGIRMVKETKRLQSFGSRAYCRVEKAENLVYRNKSSTTEYKQITLTTPMGKVGVYDLPISSPVKEGDSVLIMYETSDANAYRLVFEKGDAVIKKKSA